MTSPWTAFTPGRVPLREFWPHEQYDFCAWVKDTIEVVNEQVGLFVWGHPAFPTSGTTPPPGVDLP